MKQTVFYEQKLQIFYFRLIISTDFRLYLHTQHSQANSPLFCALQRRITLKSIIFSDEATRQLS